jgi:hypothetical protein
MIENITSNKRTNQRQKPRGLFILLFVAMLAGSLMPVTSNAQTGTCTPGTPYYSVNFTGNPTGTWISPSIYPEAGSVAEYPRLTAASNSRSFSIR